MSKLPPGTTSEPIDITIRVPFEAMKGGKKCDSYRCPLAQALKDYFGEGTTAMVDWDTIAVWPQSKAAVVTTPTPAALRAWMERYDMAECVKDLPKPLEARFSARLIYGKGDRRMVEDWCARWEREEAA